MAMIGILLGAACIYLLQVRIYRRLWDKNLHASVAFEQHAVTEGESGELVEIIINQKWLPLPMLRVQFQSDRHLDFMQEGNVAVTDRCYKNDIFSLMMYQKITRRLKFRAIRRGYYTINQIDLDSTDLFMIEKLGRSIPCSASLYVYPKPTDTRRLLIPFQKMMGDILTRRYTYEDPLEFQGIRPYQPFDNMRDVNWKASARTGELRTNIHGYTVRQEVFLLLNLESESLVDDPALKEESIRIANSLAELFLHQGIPVGLYSNAKDIISKEPLFEPAGGGVQHLLTIRKKLARLDLTQPVCDFSQFDSDLKYNQDTSMLYILISSSQRQEVKYTFEKIAKDCPGSFWLLPIRQKDKQDDLSGKGFSIIRWEVDEFAS